MRRAAILLCALVAGSLMSPAAAVRMPAQLDAVTNNCTESVPHAVHVPVLDPDDQVFLDVYLVGDRGVTNAQATAVLQDAQAAFTPLNVTLRKAGFKSANLSGTDSGGLIGQSKGLFPGGQRPAGSDIVWTLTSVDMTAPALGNAVAGQADCIGGVRYPRNAFLVSEYTGGLGFGLSIVRFYGNYDAKVAAHETGHLLGAHHHYANCAEGIATEVGPSEVEVSPCTLMTNFADFISINFSTASGAVVRAHAEEWARP